MADHGAGGIPEVVSLRVLRQVGRRPRVHRRLHLSQVRHRKTAEAEAATEEAGRAVRRVREGIKEGRQQS
ncbi:MAG: hypothetical protein HY562_01515 [Ignavibacteriales bacterium]|nr:hypothetical protein [Ignavibacteriales bacterium]